MTMKQYIIAAVLVSLFGGLGELPAASASSELESEAIAARIAEHRMGDLVVKAEPGATVHIEQLRHEFWFGATLASSAFSGRLSAGDQRR